MCALVRREMGRWYARIHGTQSTRAPARLISTPLHIPDVHLFERDGITYAVDSEAPNWIAVEERGAEMLREIRDPERAGSPLTFGSAVARYETRYQLEAGKAWLHVHDFLSALGRASMLFDAPVMREPYAGRAAYVQPSGLRELWLQINNACNLACTHCLVSSGPGGIPGMPTDEVVAIVDAAGALGIERVYITGGEPFLRRDIFDLAKHITERHGCELIFLTNATLFGGRVREHLASLSREKVKFQLPLLRPFVTRFDRYCLCVEQTSAVAVTPEGFALRETMPEVVAGSSESCSTAVARISAIDSLRWLSSGATSFFRGLNDAPKILALGVAAALAIGIGHQPMYVLVAVAMGTGSVIAGFRVPRTLAEKVTPISPAGGFAANVVTSVLVGVASRFALPVSTTHVASGTIIGVGVSRGGNDVRWKTVGEMLLAWVITLPVSALFAAVAFWLMRTSA